MEINSGFKGLNTFPKLKQSWDKRKGQMQH